MYYVRYARALVGTRRLIPPSSAAVEDLPPTAVIKCIACVSPAGRVRFCAYGSNVVLSVGPSEGPLPSAAKHVLSPYLPPLNGDTHVFRLDAGP
jgi:hypothetical protein